MISFIYSRLESTYQAFASVPALCGSLINRVVSCVRSLFSTEDTTSKSPSLIGKVTRPISDTTYVWVASSVLSKEGLSQGIIEAAKNGNEPLVQRLLPLCKEISKETLGWALAVVAQEKGGLGIKTLLESIDRSRCDLEHNLGWALGWVSMRNPEEVEQFLKLKRISKKELEEAITVPAQEGCLTGVQALLKGIDLSNFDFIGDVLGDSILNNHKELQKYLEDQEISPKARGRALVRIARCGSESKAIEKLLSSNPTIFQNDFDEAVEKAVERNNLSMVQALFLKKSTVSELRRKNLILMATKNNYKEILDELLKLEAISRKKEQEDSSPFYYFCFGM